VRVSSLYLDYGVDAQICAEDAVEISERGMRLRSRWQFEIGTQISVAIVAPGTRLNSERLIVEGIVVWCEPGPQRDFECTLLFIELPDDLRDRLRELSLQLRAEVE
jgi:hypothetical protein